MEQIKTVKVAVTTAGGDGAAVGSANSGALHGILLDIRFVFHASAPATTDTTLSYAAFNDNDGVAVPTFGNILVLTNVNTTARYMPVSDYHDDAGAVMGQQPYYWLNGPLTVSVAEANALTDCVVAYIRYLQT